jgi:nicotinamide-nucleotide adenylyltransferase
MSSSPADFEDETHFAMLIERIQQGLSTFEIAHATHARWPLSRLHHPPSSIHPLSIAILDSSFNPPTLAHLALANASTAASSPYDARLLLLSVRNADKQLKTGDATYTQRLHMMRLLAADLTDADPDTNVAVGLIDAPTFVGKASVLQEAIRERVSPCGSQKPAVRLTFLQGMDTLERFLAPRYYESEDNMRVALTHFFDPEWDNASVVCARRTMEVGAEAAEAKAKAEGALLEAASEYVSAGRVSVVDIGDTLQRLSSSQVRAAVLAGDPSWRPSVTERVAAYVEEQNLYRA